MDQEKSKNLLNSFNDFKLIIGKDFICWGYCPWCLEFSRFKWYDLLTLICISCHKKITTTDNINPDGSRKIKKLVE
jgi:hypothetical protein